MSKLNHGGVRPGAGRPKSEDTKMMRIPLGAEPLVRHLISVYKKYHADAIADTLTRASSLPELESEAVLLQLGDYKFMNGRKLRQHYMNRDGVIVERMEQQGELPV
jgi:hypothetical protein